MICLTGDIHHSSLGTNDQRFIRSPETEVKIAARFLQIAEKNRLRVTFYITGRCFDEEWPDLEPIATSPLVEVGGHTYSGIPAGPVQRLAARLRGRRPSSHAAGHGSPARQARDISRMLESAGAKTGRRIVSWRSHGLVSDRHTGRLLAARGIRFISDEISARKILPEMTPDGLVSHPINVIPDHDHLFHAHRDVEFVRKAKISGYGADEFGSDSLEVSAWGDAVLERVAEMEKAGGLATILMHPACMYLADGFRTAERVLAGLAGLKSITAAEIADHFSPAELPGGSR